MVPPVPTPATKISILPPVSAQISGPVVISWTWALAEFSNCCKTNAFGVFEAISSALATAPFMPFAGSVNTNFAPNAASMTRRSSDILAGIVKMRSYPFAAATKANPMPVFPDVGSTSVVTPGRIIPLLSASSIMLRPMRSFTLLQGLLLSSLAAIVAPLPAAILFK